MFFYIGNNCPIKSMTQVCDGLFLDNGWTSTILNDKQYWFKGYSTECVLKESIDKITDGYKPNGKWAMICSDKTIYYPVLRGFPVYENATSELTNIPLDNFQLKNYNTLNLEVSNNKISVDEASQKINKILQENILNFFKFNNIDKLNVLFSAGIDTLTVWSVVENLGIEYNLHIHEPKFNNQFGTISQYKSDLVDILRKKFWGYSLTSCFSNTNYYLTGFYSERFQLREVDQGHAIANFKGVKLDELTTKSNYLHLFLKRPKNKINNQPTYNTEKELLEYCAGSVWYDYQMWHLDTNFHLSPFYDYRITQIMLQMRLDDIIDNSLNATIQKKIIKDNKSDFLNLLPEYKNEGEIFKNYKKNFKNIQLRESININIT